MRLIILSPHTQHITTKKHLKPFFFYTFQEKKIVFIKLFHIFGFQKKRIISLSRRKRQE